MGPAKVAWEWLWLPTWVWFSLQPEDFIDTDGNVLDGFPQLIARTRDMLNILGFMPAPFLANQDGEDLTLEETNFVFTWLYMILYDIITVTADAFLVGFPFTASLAFNAILVLSAYLG